MACLLQNLPKWKYYVTESVKGVWIKSLLPYEVVKLSLKSTAGSCGDKLGYEVVFLQNGIEVERNIFK